MTTDEFLNHLHGVKRAGAGWTAKCPAHEDRQNSLSLKTGDDGRTLFKCHAGCTNEQVVESLGLKFSDLWPKDARAANGPVRRPVSTPKPVAKPAKSSKTYTINGAEYTDENYPPVWSWEELGILANVYDYHDEDGNLVQQAVRSIHKKFSQRRPDPEKPGRWKYKLDGVRRVLYRLPELIARIQAGHNVFLVEGEKDADALWDLGCPATTNSGGASKWHDSFTDVLKAANAVVIIPDNDEPGRAHAARVHAALPNSAILELPGLPPKGDVSDWLAGGGNKQALILLARQAMTEPREPEVAEQPKSVAKPVEPVKPAHKGRFPFRFLGYNMGHYYFLPEDAKQIVSMNTASMSRKTAYLDLCSDMNWWENNYMGEGGISWTTVASDLVSRSKATGLWDPSRIRGRGAWWDGGRTVLHQGESLSVDGEAAGLLDIDTRYVYQRSPSLNIGVGPALSDDHAGQIHELLTSVPWQTPLMGSLLAGWIAVAPICGVLKWRPHVWVTGRSGSGKSWILENVVGRMFGNIALNVQSVTTEAGLRQALGNDARPVVFDEAELEDQRSQMNIQRVLELARQASSETGAVIVKGSASGEAMTFTIRSCFCMGSIGVGVKRRADETRVTVLYLKSKPVDTPEQRAQAAADFNALQERVAALCTPEASAGMVTRSCMLAKTIRANATAIAIAIAQVHGSRRAGDQLGTLLAGAISLQHRRELTADEAADFVRGLPLDELTPDDSTADENRCLAHILEQRVVIEFGDKERKTRSIGELLYCCHMPAANDVPAAAALSLLRRYGMNHTDDTLQISTSHSGVAGLLKGTPWETQWSIFLKRIPGAKASSRTMRFAGGSVTRAIEIPIRSVFGHGDDYAVPFEPDEAVFTGEPDEPGADDLF